MVRVHRCVVIGLVTGDARDALPGVNAVRVTVLTRCRLVRAREWERRLTVIKRRSAPRGGSV